MSAPLNLTTDQLRRLAAALDQLSATTNVNAVTLTPNGRLELGIDDNVLMVAWDDTAKAYAISDRNGD
jgi:enoyl-CoA hydratase/carnithine racemase